MEELQRHISKKKKKLLSIMLIFFMSLTFFSPIKVQAEANYYTVISGLVNPTSIAVDSSGNILVAQNNGEVIKYNYNGTGGRVIISGLGTQTFVTTDSSNNIYTLDSTKFVKKYNSDGTGGITVTPNWGTMMNNPKGFEIDNNANILMDFKLYQYEYYRENIFLVKIHKSSDYWSATVISQIMNNLLGFDLDKDRVYIFTLDSSGIVKRFNINEYSIEGTNIVTGLVNPTGIAIDKNGDILIINSSGELMKFNSDGTGGIIIAAGLGNPSAIETDNDGNIFVLDKIAGKVMKVGLKNIESVNTLNNITVQNGTTISEIGLPDDIIVTLEDLTTTSAAVVWNDGNPTYDGTVTGTYTFTGTLTLPDGVINKYDLKASMNATVEEPRAVLVENVPDINVENGTTLSDLNLPNTVTVTLNDLTETSVAVTWDNGTPLYDGNTEGTYTYAGTLNMPNGTINPNNLKAYVNVVVGAPTSKIAESVSSISDISVENGTALSDLNLPDTVNVILNDLTTINTVVTWDNGTPSYDGNTKGTYTFTGTLSMPNGFINPNNLKVYIDVIVGEAYIPPTDGDITTPASVTINGTERVGNTLEAILLTEGKSQFTTPAGVTYEWSRLEDKNSSSGTFIGDGDTYKLVSSDKGYYIKVTAAYEGKTFEDITDMIESSLTSTHKHHHSSKQNSSNNNTTQPASGWENIGDNIKRYFENGQPVAGWKQIDGSWYLFDSTGVMQSGWRMDNNQWYYLKNDGAMATGWELVNGKWYLLKPSGEMVTGWAKIGDIWYFLNSDGSMATGWIELDGKWYYLYGDGSLAVNTTINGYMVNEDGEWIQ